MEHIKITIELKRYICDKCGKPFTSGYLLNKHTNNCNEQHNGEPINTENFKLKVTNAISKILTDLTENSVS